MTGETTNSETTGRVTAPRPVLQVRDLECGYGEQSILSGIDFSVADGEICALLGTSGCGKTTLLKALAGLVQTGRGTVCLRGRALQGLPAEQRNIGLIFQDYALFPWLTVRDNITFGLAELCSGEQQRVCDEMLSLVGLADYAARYPHQLSGGQQQRVAIARALARQPELLLLDEPFSNIDPQLRPALAAEVRQLLRQQGIPAILVTHNKDEAFALADRIMVLHQGRIVQQGSAGQLYQQPQSRFVAELLGCANWLPARRLDDGRIRCALGILGQAGGRPGSENGAEAQQPVVIDGQLLRRPHELTVTVDPEGDGVISNQQFLGSSLLLELQWQQQMVRVELPVQPGLQRFAVGSRVRLALA